MKKAEFSRGLQHKKSLVRFVTLQILVATLKSNEQQKLRAHYPDPQILFRYATASVEKENDRWIRALSLRAIRYYLMRMPNMMRNIRFDFRRLVDLDRGDDVGDEISITEETIQVLLKLEPIRCDWLRDKKFHERFTRMFSDTRYHELIVNIIVFEEPLWSSVSRREDRVRVARAIVRDHSSKCETFLKTLSNAVRNPFVGDGAETWSKLVQEKLSVETTEDVTPLAVTRETLCALPIRQFLHHFAQYDRSSRESLTKDCPPQLVIPVTYGLLQCRDHVENETILASSFAQASSSSPSNEYVVRVLETALEGKTSFANAVLSAVDSSSYLLARAELRTDKVTSKDTILNAMRRVSKHFDRDVARDLCHYIGSTSSSWEISPKRGLKFTRAVRGECWRENIHSSNDTLEHQHSNTGTPHTLRPCMGASCRSSRHKPSELRERPNNMENVDLPFQVLARFA